MEIIIAIASIFAISGLAWGSNKIVPFKICPICAGVAGTWAWMLVGLKTGLLPTSYLLLVGILMGGSVVGIAYQLEKKPAFAKASAGKLLLWKVLFIPTGFTAVYGLLAGWWIVFAAALAIIVIIAWIFLTPTGAESKVEEKNVEQLEKEMKKCC